MRPPHRNRAPLTPVVATKFILKYYRGQCATIFIEQQVYSVSRLFLVKKKNQTFFSLHDNLSAMSVNESSLKYISFLVKLNSLLWILSTSFISFSKLHFFFFCYRIGGISYLLSKIIYPWNLNNNVLVLVNSFVFDPLILVIVQQRYEEVEEISNRHSRSRSKYRAKYYERPFVRVSTRCFLSRLLR